jgi:ketosteroid isomerase-like protein
MNFRVFALLMLGIWLVGCSPAGEVSRLGREIRSRIPSYSEETPAPPPADSSTDVSAEAAVQLVVQRANFQQEQAIATRDPTAMRDSSTDRYYREMRRINQALLDSGVSSIKLLNLEWGPVTVSGETATATAFETWSTTLADGTHDQSRDRNLYRLVRQNGVWKIDADEHPDDVQRLPPNLPQV